MKAVWAILKRDLVLAWRQGGGVGTAIGFFLTVIVLLPLGIGPDIAILQRIAPGGLWIALLLSVLLSADQIYQSDYDDGSLELMTFGTVPLEVVAATKSLAHWLTSGLPLAIAAPLLGFLLNLDTALIIPLLGAMMLGSLGLSFLAGLGAAVTVGLRRGGLLVSLLVLPLYVPVLIFGIAAGGAGTVGPGVTSASFSILFAITLVILVVAPFGSGAALRAYMR
ncbi:ABC transporter involved in cytochrome c biogenesis, CcmB subunit [hydrothermal vent metagenome]|uniref:Heme exporter protein B n=1 Tax=hydrothermal vent metagenome TaxID=652676 RepID=A0A3B0RED8_9ZZZZ